MNDDQFVRRKFLKMGAAALAMIPITIAASRAYAATNAAMRTSFKYQPQPDGDKSCTNCMQFVPGASAKESGGCKVMPGDTEISPQGYCMVWTKKG